MYQRFQNLKKRFHIESEVLSAMIIGYFILFISGIIFLQNIQGNNYSENKQFSEQQHILQPNPSLQLSH